MRKTDCALDAKKDGTLYSGACCNRVTKEPARRVHERHTSAEHNPMLTLWKKPCNGPLGSDVRKGRSNKTRHRSVDRRAESPPDEDDKLLSEKCNETALHQPKIPASAET